MKSVKIPLLMILLTAVHGAIGSESIHPSLSSAGASSDWPSPVMDDALHHGILLDQLEYRSARKGADSLAWDALAWVGGDRNRLWLESEGHAQTEAAGGEIDRLDAYFGHLIAPYWDLLGGAGYQRRYGVGSDVNRLAGVVALHGLTPYGLAIDATLRASEGGGFNARLEAETDLLLTQRLILQPRLETAAASRERIEWGEGVGLNRVVLGLRLRYEVWREFAPYVGLSWSRSVAGTADLTRTDEMPTEDWSLLTGVRLWF
jgi:copper resistance protein B